MTSIPQFEDGFELASKYRKQINEITFKMITADKITTENDITE